MAEAKLVVIYPRPTDIEAFEKKIYLTEHVPMAVKKLIGKTKIVATKITASPQGQPSSCSRAGSCANLATKKWQSTGPLTGTANRGCPRWFGRAKFRLMASRPTLSRLSRDMGNWLYQSTLPKLFFIGETGRILVAGRGREFARSWPNQQVVTVKGVHYLQEASPVELGTALATFVKSVRA
jgi:pimeloyl-ACP methyl ester carboxylesterase